MEKVRWAALITFFALFTLTLSLGVWQINRGYEKKELENTYSLQQSYPCLLYTSPSPRDRTRSRMPSSA